MLVFCIVYIIDGVFISGDGVDAGTSFKTVLLTFESAYYLLGLYSVDWIACAKKVIIYYLERDICVVSTLESKEKQNEDKFLI
jgi:hypothetical protein